MNADLLEAPIKIEHHLQKKPSLPFFHYRPRPEHPDWEALAEDARALAREIAPRLEKPAPLALWRRRLRSYRTAAQNYVINRRRHRAGREDLLPLYFIWTLLRSCNFRCAYCDDHRGQRYPDLPKNGLLDTAQAKTLLEVMRTRTPSVYFAGGEPTLRKDLPELTEHAADLGYYPIVVNTNGSLLGKLLQQPRWRGWLSRIDILVVSLDSLNPEVLRGMWRSPEPERVLRNLLLLRELAAAHRTMLLVNTVIQPGKIQEARDVLDFVNDLGIGFSPVPMNVGPRIHPALPKDPEFRDLSRTILERKAAGFRISGSPRLLSRLLFSAKLNCRNTLKPHIDLDGRLFWPCKSSFNVSPEMVSVLDHPNVDSLYRAARIRLEPKGFHGAGEKQCGGDCNWAQNYTTDAYHYGLEHPWSLIEEIATFISE